MVSIYLYAAILALNLSHVDREPLHEHLSTPGSRDVTHTTALGRSYSGDIRGSGVGQLVGPPTVKTPFDQAQTPVPYAGLWNNPLGQTAQQFVAILSTLEDEGLNIDSFKDDWPE